MDKLKKIFYLVIVIFGASCGSKSTSEASTAPAEAQSMVKDAASYDPSRGEGKWTADMLKLGEAVDATMAESGGKIQSVKCSSCHKDPEVQAQLEICLVRMPNQNLTDDEARHILEYMRQNDSAK